MSQSRSRILKGVRLAALAALGATALAVTPAWATVITWHYDASTSFTGATFTTTNAACPTTNTSTTLAWGCTNNNGPQSSLVLAPSATTGNSVDTYTGSGTPSGSPFVSDPGIILTHNNNVINIDSTSPILKTATLGNTITLTPFNPLGSALTPISLDFGVNFTETPNTSGTCVAPSTTPCADIFVFDNTSLNHSFTYNDGTGDQTYFLSLFPASGGALSTLTNAECLAAGASPGCFGFVTQENTANHLHFGLSITSQRIGVPEPGELGLMGLGLLGLAGLVVLRRRRATDDKVD